MPVVDFPAVQEAQDFTPLPAGEYLCRVENIEERQTKYNDDMWNVRFAVIDGEYIGRYIFDRITFSEAAMPRVKLFAKRLGLDVSKRYDLTPKLALGQAIWVTVEEDSYEKGDQIIKTNNVPYAGYREYEEAKKARKPAASRSRKGKRASGLAF